MIAYYELLYKVLEGRLCIRLLFKKGECITNRNVNNALRKNISLGEEYGDLGIAESVQTRQKGK